MITLQQMIRLLQMNRLNTKAPVLQPLGSIALSSPFLCEFYQSVDRKPIMDPSKRPLPNKFFGLRKFRVTRDY